MYVCYGLSSGKGKKGSHADKKGGGKTEDGNKSPKSEEAKDTDNDESDGEAIYQEFMGLPEVVFLII